MTPLPIPTSQATRPVLVIDLDETLVHNNQARHYDPFPRLNKFYLQTRGYRVVVFTAGSEEYAQGIVKFLDPDGGNICAHLSFEACTQVSWIGRPAGPSQTKDLTKVVANLCLEMQPDNGILIRGWSGEAGDKELFRLEHFLCHYARAKDMGRVAERWKTAVFA